ncbi:MAG: 50S ribosomal protein L2, partial [Nitrospirae bacterium]|nr:50S ribosomal protein L2 [Nitrospirota bacterium]
MGIKNFRPTSPARRQMTVLTNEDLSVGKPEKALLEYIKSSGGRNSQGRISVRFRGGGHKRMYRRVDFKRDKSGITARV